MSKKLTNCEKDMLNALQEMNDRLNSLEEWRSIKIQEEKKAMEYLQSLQSHHPGKDF